MSDFLKTLLRKNSLRKQCQDLEVAEVEKVIADLTDIAEELKAKELAREQEEKAKRAAIEQIQESMRQAGVDLTDLMDIVDTKVVAKQTVKAKYQITDDLGNTHTWSGRGRTPVVFAAYMERFGVAKDELPSAE